MRFKWPFAIALCVNFVGFPLLADNSTASTARQLAQLEPISAFLDRMIFFGKSSRISMLNGSELSQTKQEAIRLFVVQEWNRQATELESIFVSAIESHLSAREQEILLAHFSDAELQQALDKFAKINGAAQNDLANLVDRVDEAINEQISKIENQ